MKITLLLFILIKTNTALPGARSSSKPSGLAPIFKKICSTITRTDLPPTPVISLNGHVINSQALVLATLANNRYHSR